MAGIDFDAVERLVPLRRVLDLLGWQASSAYGDDERGHCPIHSGHRHRSRSFSARGELWYCWRCRRGGTCLRLWQIVHGLAVWDAARSLCAAAGVEVPYLPHWDGPRRRRRRIRDEGR